MVYFLLYYQHTKHHALAGFPRLRVVDLSVPHSPSPLTLEDAVLRDHDRFQKEKGSGSGGNKKRGGKPESSRPQMRLHPRTPVSVVVVLVVVQIQMGKRQERGDPQRPQLQRTSSAPVDVFMGKKKDRSVDFLSVESTFPI